ncbi:calpain-9 [Delphinus delphis]|uniref:calpain-9 n=1 Tax=Delphinus delphis TaxID=9728 RepID=UPI0028C46D21|nr:calpain-9 [Delphinus delphis]
MPYLYRAPGPQEPPAPKDARITHSSGQSLEELRQTCLQKGVLLEDADFPANSSSLFYSERPLLPFVWKRRGAALHPPPPPRGRPLPAVGPSRRNALSIWEALLCLGNLGCRPGASPTKPSWLPAAPSAVAFQHSRCFDDGGFRLNGSYEALKRGSAIEAIEDFTAGVAETFTTKEAPGNFSEILDKALKRGCLVGCSIDIRNAAEPEARTPFGLIRGHAYTVTGVDQVNFRGQNTELVRVRNPWGQVEWTGCWSDSSSEWRSVGPAEQKRLCRTALDDREFWCGACLCFPFRVNSITETDIKFEKLSLTSCKNIISLMDTSGNGKLGFGEFRVFWDKLKKWTNLFLQFDADKSGTVSPYELRTALKATGFQLSPPLLQLIVLRYADQERQLGFDDFLNCLVRLETASRTFQALGTKNKEFIHLNINEV